MPVTIEKTFRFDAGHRCLGFDNMKEETLHGHTWHLRVIIETTSALDGLKTIVDTNELARVVRPLIARFDHAFILWAEDPIREPLVATCRAAGIEEKLLLVDFNPTVEGLAEHFFTIVRDALHLRDAVVKRVDLDAATTLRASYAE
jgi:6-pyruvoyltetrahydropterin/6-carboxytetrahydropterin synthase